MTTRALTMMNEAGDQTIIWDESGDEKMLPIIERKMREGVVFFIVEPRFFGLLPSKKTELKSVEEARKHRALAIRDEDISKFVGDGDGDVVKAPNVPLKTVRKSKNAKEIVQNQSVGVRAAAGG